MHLPRLPSGSAASAPLSVMPPPGGGNPAPPLATAGASNPQFEDLNLLASVATAIYTPPSPGQAQACVRQMIGRSRLWLELQDRTGELLQVLCHAYGGQPGPYSQDYDALRLRLDAISANPALAARCLKDMLFEALMRSPFRSYPHAASVAKAVAGQNSALESGRLSYAQYKANMHGVFVRLARLATTLWPSLPAERARVRRMLAELGVAGHALALPDDRPDDPAHLEAVALHQAAAWRGVCDEADELPPDDLRDGIYARVTDSLRGLPIHAWCTSPGAQPMPVGGILRMVRRAAWMAGLTTEGAIDAADLSPRHREAALQGARTAIHDWLDAGQKRSWGRQLRRALHPVHADIAADWSTALMCWRGGGPQRDALLAGDTGMLPRGVPVLLCHEAGRGDPGEAAHRLQAVQAGLAQVFERCLDACAIEGFDRELLASVCQAQWSEAARQVSQDAREPAAPH